MYTDSVGNEVSARPTATVAVPEPHAQRVPAVHDLSEAQPVAHKRKRGRPRKEVLAEDGAEDVTPTQLGMRKRGRSRRIAAVKHDAGSVACSELTRSKRVKHEAVNDEEYLPPTASVTPSRSGHSDRIEDDSVDETTSTLKRSTSLKSTKRKRDQETHGSPSAKTGRKGVSFLTIPSIRAAQFGIVQERMKDHPFWLLIAVIFLNKTTGKSAVPTFYDVKTRWPTPEALAGGNQAEIFEKVKHLGFGTQRSRTLIKFATTWIHQPPAAGRRYRKLNYPAQGDGKAYKPSLVIETDDDDCAGALEIGHLPGCGRYAYDSWRIFCRDALRGVNVDDESVVPEWQKVLPQDKELKAALRWMWSREGWIWSSDTGEKRRATPRERQAAVQGGGSEAAPLLAANSGEAPAENARGLDMVVHKKTRSHAGRLEVVIPQSEIDDPSQYIYYSDGNT